MILNPIRLAYNCRISPLIKRNRSLRPRIKISKESFQLCLDVHQFNRDELKVKAHPNYVVIEGKQEKNTTQGYILRQFVRKFKLPDGSIPHKIESKLSPEGILTITAPRSFCDSYLPCEAVAVPINYGPTEKCVDEEDTEKEKNIKELKEKKLGPISETGHVCNYPRVKPQFK